MPSSLEIDQAISRIEKARALLEDQLIPKATSEVLLDLLDEALALLQTLKAPW